VASGPADRFDDEAPALRRQGDAARLVEALHVGRGGDGGKEGVAGRDLHLGRNATAAGRAGRPRPAPLPPALPGDWSIGEGYGPDGGAGPRLGAVALVYVNGELVAPENALISVFDHGLVVGDGAFETILLHRGRAFALTRHLERLERSAAGLGLGPIDVDAVRKAVEAVAASAEFELGRIRVTFTAGVGPLGSARIEGEASLVVAATADGGEHAHASVAVVAWTRNERGALSGLKTTSYAENALALHYAHERDADEAIFANTQDRLCEGTGSNVFVVRDGVLLTPPLSAGCLAGITRALVLERHGGVEADLPIGEFGPDGIEEAFLTSTLRGVQPIATIDGQELGAVPGPVTEKARAAYNRILDDEIDP